MAFDEGVEVVEEPDRIHQYAASAEEAGLTYVTDDAPGYRRKRWGRGFTYLDEEGDHLDDVATKERIDALAIPPDWTEVWIAADPNAHIQATGRDAAGRKQYVYHPRWEEVRRRVKFEHLIRFAKRLPELRRRVDRDLRSAKMTRERVVAVVVALLDRTFLRIGHEEYLRDHGSHGLLTIGEEHVELKTTSVTLSFIGKSEVEQTVAVYDRRLARQVRRCCEAVGERLFAYLEGGKPRPVTAGEVNRYLEETTGIECSTKDFRTWGATRTATEALLEFGPPESDEERRDFLKEAVCQTAQVLSNTERVCRDYYIHPSVVSAYEAGRFWPRFEAFEAATDRGAVTDRDLDAVEAFIVWLAERDGWVDVHGS